MRDDGSFALFCTSLFRAYYLREPLEPTPEFMRLLYDLGQGIIDIVIKLFVLAQLRALSIGEETVTAALLREVYADCFELLHEHLDDVRRGAGLDEVRYERALRGSTIDRLALVAGSKPRWPEGVRQPLPTTCGKRQKATGPQQGLESKFSPFGGWGSG